MFPYIQIFNKVITSYSIMVLIGVLVLLFVCIKWAKRFKVDDNNLIVLMLWGFLGAFIGSHILYTALNYNLVLDFFASLNQIHNVNEFINALAMVFSGSVFYGGLIGALIAGFIYLKVKKMDIKLYTYIMAPLIPLFHFFGRIGCFLSGCCYGIPSKIGFTYHHALVETANNINRFPIQLVEAGFNLILFVVLYILQKKNKCKNSLLALYLLLYSCARFIFEFFRGDEYRGFFLGFSTSQWISILIFIISVGYLISLLIKKKRN